MAKFDAATAVDPMEYDFSAFEGPQGVIPEPSQEQIDTFFNHLKEVRLFVGGLVAEGEKLVEAEDVNEAEVKKFVEELPEDKLREYQDQFSVWVYDVSSKTLEVDMLRRLPGRIFAAFFRWLSGELGPKDSPATKG